jgi:hypothetical protein
VLLQGQSIPVTTIRDTLARIVQAREYREDVSTTLLARAWEWITRHVSDLFREATQSRGAYILSMLLLAMVIATTITRAVIVARARRLAASQLDVLVTAAEQLAQARVGGGSACLARGGCDEPGRAASRTPPRLKDGRRLRARVARSG